MLERDVFRRCVAALKKVDGRLWGLLTIVIFSLLFQLLLSGYKGGDQATTPDSQGYIDVAANLQEALHGVSELRGDVLRTPGYPLLIMAVAKGAEIKLSDVELPVRNWEQSNSSGKILVHRIIMFQALLGFLIPLVIYAIALSMGGSVALSVAASLSYFSDIRSVAFQYVVLNETQSIFLMLLSLLTFILAMKRKTIFWIALCGLISSFTLIVRPPLAVLPVIMCGAAYVILRSEGRNFTTTASFIARYIGFVAIFPLMWSLINLQSTGHFFFTKNAAITLQNFAARHFVQLNIEDRELSVLQKHARIELEKARELGLRDKEIYAFGRSLGNVASELEVNDQMYLYLLVERANRIAIVNYPFEFIAGGVSRWIDVWIKPFGNIKNAYAIDRERQFGLAGRYLANNGYMLFGPLTLYCFILLIPLAAFRLPKQSRILFLSFLVFVIAYSIAVTLADENEPIRHAMQIRIIVNSMLIASCLIIAARFELWKLPGARKSCG